MNCYGIDLHTDSFFFVKIDDGNNVESKKVKLDSGDFISFLMGLNKDDYIALETCTNGYWFYDQVYDRVKCCFVVNTWKFLDVARSNKKKDKIDALKLAKKLKFRITMQGDENDLPTVYVPEKTIRELRSLFTCHDQLKRERTRLKNRIRSVFLESEGSYFKELNIFKEINKKSMLENFTSNVMKVQAELLFETLEYIEKQMEKLQNEILKAGSKYYREIDILTSIKGISPFIALGIISDIGDIERFSSAKKLSSYLRAAPVIRESNNRTKIGSVNKCSRKVSLTLLTQPLHHAYRSSMYLLDFYERKKITRNVGRARIAVAHKIITAIYHMLKEQKYFYWMDDKNHNKKMAVYNSFLKKQTA